MVSIATAVRLFLVVSVAILQLVHCNPVDDQLIGGRIINGTIIDITRAPYQVSLRDSTGFTFCGGSIIGLRHILTAAHCFDEVRLNQTRVVYGVSTIFESGTSLKIVKLVKPSDYISANTGNDIAILKVESQIRLSSTARIIELTGNPVEVGMSLSVTGWGFTGEGGPRSEELRRALVFNVDKTACSYAYRNTGNVIDYTMMCAKSQYSDSCVGDSGGPLVRTVNGESIQVGIISWGIGCGRPEYPGVYTDLIAFARFIDNAIRNL